MDNNNKYIKKDIICWNNNKQIKKSDYIIEEKSVTIYANSKEIDKILCSPWDLEYFAVGYLFFIEKIHNSKQIKEIIVDKNIPSVNVIFNEDCIFNTSDKNQHNDFFASPQQICTLASKLENISDVFEKTGGIHCAALADSDNILFYHEDIGRHNVLNKLLGRCIIDNVDTSDKILVFSGRLPLEIISRALKIKAPIIVSCSAPTNDALNLANKGGLTVIGFARGSKFNVYTHSYRIK